jgi:hypothetical protein
MHKGIVIAVTGLAIVGIATANTMQAATPVTVTPNECVATVASPIVAGTANQEVTVSISEELTDSVAVTVAPESNLKVAGVTKDANAKVVKLKVDATKGAPGTWPLTLTGKNTSCKGVVKVATKG